MWRRYQARDGALVGANVWDAEQAVRNFQADYEITYPSGTSEGELAAEYGLTDIPETFIIDAEGMLASRWFGPLTDAQLSTVIEEVLEDGGRAAEGTP